MRYQDGLRRLQVGVRWHGCAARSFGAREDRLDPIGDQGSQSIDVLAYEEAEIGCDLFVAAAAGVQLVAGGADQRGKLLFYEVVNVFGFRIVEKLGRRFGALADFFERLHDFGKLFGRKHSGVFESVGVGAAGREFEGQQPLIVGERALPFFKFGVKRLPEAAGPHLHGATSGAKAPVKSMPLSQR